MEATSKKRSLRFELFEGRFEFCLVPRVLRLRTAFGTSHSSTTTRTNALIRVRVYAARPRETSVPYEEGWGEIGLPPKKPGVYEADYEDVVQFYGLFRDWAQAQDAAVPSNIDPEYDPFSELPEDYFGSLRDFNDETLFGPRDQVTRSLFWLLDGFTQIHSTPEARPSRSGLENALFDLWGRQLRKPLHRLLMSSSSPPHEEEEDETKPKTEAETVRERHSFYTVGLNPDVAEMKRSLLFGLEHTPLIKIKMNDDIEFAGRVFRELHETMEERLGGSGLVKSWRWTVDANAAWSVETALKFLQVLRPYASRVYAIEQPFPPKIPEEEKERWVEVRKAWNALGISILADETVCTLNDVRFLAEAGLCDGVNIKVEKAGGLRGAILAAHEARSRGLGVWLGMMVSSNLGTTSTAQLLSLTTDPAASADLDGALLVDELVTTSSGDEDVSKEDQTIGSAKFEAGFEWIKPEGIIRLYPDRPGLGLIHTTTSS